MSKTTRNIIKNYAQRTSSANTVSHNNAKKNVSHKYAKRMQVLNNGIINVQDQSSNFNRKRASFPESKTK